MKTILSICCILSTYASLAQSSTELKPDEDNGVVHISVTNHEQKPSAGEIIHFVGQKSKKDIKVISNDEGKCDVLLPEGDIYEIRMGALDGQKDYSTLEVPAGPGVVEGSLTITWEMSKSVSIDNIHFKTGSATIEPTSFGMLNDLSEIMLAKKNMKIKITGHTDNVGSKESNQVLSVQRAEAIKAYMVKKGVTAANIVTDGKGASTPITENTTEQGRAQNRRIEIEILSE